MLIRVNGEPAPQGSTRAFAVRKGGVPTGRTVVTAANKRTRPWRDSIMAEAAEAIRMGQRVPGACEGAPVTVNISFMLKRPASHYGQGRNAARLLPSAPLWPAVRPDVDKLCRAVLDALSDMGIYRDDAQVISLTAIKTYATPGTSPGALIQISGADARTMKEAGYGARTGVADRHAAER
jgi:Holliday junction resolvase RusA-like endonuclease